MQVSYSKKAILTIIIAIVGVALAIVLLPISTNSNITAYAVNADWVPYVGFADGYSSQNYNAEQGVKLAITCSTEVDTLGYVFQYTDETKDASGTFELSVNPDDPDEWIATYTAYANGYLIVTPYDDDDDETDFSQYSTTYPVSNIDSVAPFIDTTESSSLLNGDTVEYSRTISDRSSSTDSLAYNSYGNVVYVAVFFFDEDFDYSSLTEDDLEFENLKENDTGIITFLVDQVYTGSFTKVTVEFTASEDGYYFLYAMDNVGNSSLTYMFALDLEPVYPLDINGYTVDCATLIENAYKQYENGLDLYTSDILTELKTATDNLFLSFANDLGTDAQYDAWVALKAAQTAYNSAYANYEDIDLINGEFIEGNIYFKNLNQTTVPLLCGETVQPTIVVAEFTNLNQVDDELLDVASVEGANLVIRLSYSLTKDGVLVLPDEALTLFMTLPSTYYDICVCQYSATGGYTVVSTATYGSQWLQFDIPYNNKDYYLVIKVVEDPTFFDNFTTWELVGMALGLVAIVVVLAVGIVYLVKKNKKDKTPTENSEEEGATEVNIEEPEEPIEPEYTPDMDSDLDSVDVKIKIKVKRKKNNNKS